MTKLMTTLTIAAIASILMIGGFVASPNAYSSGNNHHDDDCDQDHHGYDDDCGNEKPDDPCDCEKPDTLKFIFSAPTGEELSEFRIEVFKKLENIDNPDKKLTSINDVTSGTGYQLLSSSFGKDKLNSNTAFAIYKVVEGLDDQLVASMEIHTSCSQPLFKGLVVSNNGYSLGITDGLKNDKTSIPEFDPLICVDETAPEQMGSIVIRKAITNDNGGTASAVDFELTITNVETNVPIILNHDLDDSVNPLANVNEVPVGTYILSETTADEFVGKYTTVLIAGDTKCPSMTDEPFTIKKGKRISCTIYNDDNGNGSGGTGVGAGVVFNPTSIPFSGNIEPPCSEPVGGYLETTPACLEFNGDTIFVTDVELTPTAIIVWSIVQSPIPMELSAPQCTLEGLQDTGFDLGAEDVLTFVLVCPNGLVAGSNNYLLNFALIETQ